MALREYQQECERAVFREWETVRSTLVVMPTGTGKTRVFAGVIKSAQPGRAMVLAHREELIWQARDRIQQHTGLECSVEMAAMSARNGSCPVVIATVQTLNSDCGDRTRMSRFNPKQFKVLVIDEAHHAVAKTYQNIIHYFTQNNPDIKVLGVTATPDRADEEALGKVFDTVAFDYEILDAIHDGWLVPIQQQVVFVDGLDYSHIRTTAGDLNGGDLAAVMEAEGNLQGVAGALIQIVGNRRMLVFTASVKQAEVVSEIFNRHKPNCSTWVCGKTPKEERRQIVKDFAAGKHQIVCNCDVFGEGFDDPGVEVIGMAKPTKSRSKYAQMVGRAMRPLPGVVDDKDDCDHRKEHIAQSPKPSMLVVDFVGNSGRHKLMTSADILGGKVSEAAVTLALKRAREAGGPVNMSEVLDQSEEDIREQIKQAQLREAARKARLVANVRFTSRTISPFDIWEISPVRERAWDSGKALSEKQRMLLLKQGIDPNGLTYTEGRQLLAEQFRRWDKKLCSLRQAAVLKRYGYETHDLTRDAASKLLDALKANNWRKPVAIATQP